MFLKMHYNQIQRAVSSGQVCDVGELTEKSLTVEPGDPRQLYRDVIHQHLLFTHRNVQVDLERMTSKH